MKVSVDDDRCRGHAACCAICPEVFEIGDGGYAEALQADVPVEFESAVAQAAANCPERAILTS
jgi:ferredoxin